MRLDVQDWTSRSARVEVDDLDLDAAFRERPLDPASLRCLRYMHDVEHHTICYLRDLLLTPAHKDATVTSFLAMWTFEEFWHGEAIGQVLAAHEEASGITRIADLRSSLGSHDRFMPLTHMLGAAIAAKSWIAIHMTWGAVNEWTTQAGYARLSAKAKHPVLTELLGRIMKQEGRHIDFYAGQAESRLDGDRRAQRLTRLALKRFWRPVGANVMPTSEVRFLISHLFDGDDGRAMAQRIDRRVDRLPGLSGLGLIERARATALAAA